MANSIPVKKGMIIRKKGMEENSFKGLGIGSIKIKKIPI
jgi:hypothetical protein